MNSHLYWSIWFIALVMLYVFASRKKRLTGAGDTEIIFGGGLALAGIFALCKVLVSLSTFYEDIEAVIDWDGTTALSLACFLGIVIAAKEIRKLLVPPRP